MHKSVNVETYNTTVDTPATYSGIDSKFENIDSLNESNRIKLKSNFKSINKMAFSS
jgi:hypothetical protein